MRERDARVVGAVIGVSAIAGAAVLILRGRSARASVSPREREWRPAPPSPPAPLAVPPVSPPVVTRPPSSEFPTAPTAPSVPPTKIDTKTESWTVALLPFTTIADVPLAFAKGWIQKESGGNPCSIGTPGARGPDGHPREQGIGQLFNPDDMKRFGIPSGAFRAYCKAGTQEQTRELTFEEILAQAKALVQLITYSRSVADAAMKEGGVFWSAPDYWKAVKLVHALPGLVRTGMPRVAASLGRPPRDWWEFKAAILGGLKVDRATEKYRNQFAKWFKNAEAVAANVSEDAPRRVA